MILHIINTCFYHIEILHDNITFILFTTRLESQIILNINIALNI